MTKTQSVAERTPAVEMVPNRVLDAYRKHLRDGSDYAVVLREESRRGRFVLSEAIKRRARKIYQLRTRKR
jgi:hypothetical protein